MIEKTKNKFLFTPFNYALKTINSDDLIPVGKIYCVGRNYLDHAIEMNESIEKKEPFFFSKPPQALTQKNKISFPNNTNNLHHEVELVVTIASKCKNINPKNAEEYILGYSVGIDLTKRDLQKIAKEGRKPWDLSKGFDNSAPISLINLSNNKIIKKGKIELKVNGVTKQLSDISEMIWPIDYLIANLSNYITLYPGDMIFTGTPAGVGQIKLNDRLEASIERVGELEVIFTE
jgi:fumarylpyruvate hydrolase